MPRIKIFPLLSLAATLCTPAFGQYVTSARPGTLNYIEGQAKINGEELSTDDVGKMHLGASESLETADGKAEVLLTPGVYLRVGVNSSIRMVAPELTHTEIEVVRGKAEVEVDQLYRQNDLRVDLHKGSNKANVQTHLVKEGLYEFDADAGTVRVYNGRAELAAASADGKLIVLKGGKQLTFADDSSKPQGFSKKELADDLTNWSDLRSSYLGQANTNLATQYAGNSHVNSGWFWDGGLSSYTYLPGSGSFFSPFGYGFYSPSYLYGGGSIYGYPSFGYNGYGYGGYPYGGGGYSVQGGRSGNVSLQHGSSGYNGTLANRGGSTRPVGGTVGSLTNGNARVGAGANVGSYHGGGVSNGGGNGGFHGGTAGGGFRGGGVGSGAAAGGASHAASGGGAHR